MADTVEVQVLTTPDRVLEARRLQGSRYLEAGFVEALSSDGVVDDSFVPISTYFGAVDRLGDVVGVARLIPHSPAGLPALEQFELTGQGEEAIHEIPPGRLAEVSALAVARGQGAFKSGKVANALYRAMYQYSVVAAAYTHWCAALDVRVKAHLMNSHNFLFEEIGEPMDYLGSSTVPVILDLLGQARHFAQTSPERNAFFLSGLDIDLRGDRVALIPASGEFLPRTDDGSDVHVFPLRAASEG